MLYVFYTAVLFLLTVYSYAQIDLNLTLSSNKFYQAIQQQLIFLGYYNRPLSTIILVVIILLLYLFYLRILFLVNRNKLSFHNVKWLVVITSVILFFAYSAFSHDLFNYMFDARIITRYGQNPYFHSALDFPADLWTRFMHWTHRTYPYGPVWLLVTLPFSFLGFGKFVLTLFNFKLMFAIFHVGNIYLIYKILGKINPKLSLLAASIYAFNPVVLIESLVSPHNEVVMLFFLLLAIYLMTIKKNHFAAIISLLLSAGIKFITIILLPLFILRPPGRSPFGHLPGVVKRLLEGEFWDVKLIFFLLIPPLLYEIYFRESYSWYFVPVIGIGALLIKYPSINIFISGISLASFLRYLPFLYTGEYTQATKGSQNLLFIIVACLTFLLVVLNYFLSKRNLRKLN